MIRLSVFLFSFALTLFVCEADASAFSESRLAVAAKRCNFKDLKLVESLKPGIIKLNSVRGDESALFLSLFRCRSPELIKFIRDNGGLSPEGVKEWIGDGEFAKTTQLHAAVRAISFDFSIVKELVEKEVSINSINKYRETALSLAARHRKLEVVRYLVDSGARITPSSIIEAADNRFSDKVFFYLIDQGASFPDDVSSIVNKSCRQGHEKIIDFLINEKGLLLKQHNAIDLIRSGRLSVDKIEQLLLVAPLLDPIDILHAAASSSQKGLFLHFYNKLGVDIKNTIDSRGNTLLHSLSSHIKPWKNQNKTLELAQLLIDLGVNIHHKNDYGSNALDTFSQSRLFDADFSHPIIDFLLNKGADATRSTYDSIPGSNLERFNFFASYNPDWDKIFIDGLGIAYLKPDPQEWIYEHLIKDGLILKNWITQFPSRFQPNVNTAKTYANFVIDECFNKRSRSLLHQDLHSNIENFKLLVGNYGMSAEGKQSMMRRLLKRSEYCEVSAMMSYLLENGVDFNFVDENGNSPLAIALHGDADGETINLILENKGLVFPLLYNGQYENFAEKLHSKNQFIALNKIISIENQEYKKGIPTTFLLEFFDMEKHWEVSEVVKYMIENGAIIDVQDEVWNSALHYSVNKNNKVWTEFLLANNASINLQNKSCKTPLEIAVKNGFIEIAQLLLDAGGLILSCPPE